jgi:hypothetical protein
VSWHKDELFELKVEVSATVKPGGRVIVKTPQTTYEPEPDILAILGAFCQPTPVAQAVQTLIGPKAGFAAFTCLMDQVNSLIKAGTIGPRSGNSAPHLGRHGARFDSLPVHVRMLNDTARTLAYQSALRAMVKPERADLSRSRQLLGLRGRSGRVTGTLRTDEAEALAHLSAWPLACHYADTKAPHHGAFSYGEPAPHAGLRTL